LSKLILDHVTTAMEELSRAEWALRRSLRGLGALPNEAVYKHLINAQDECEQARIHTAKLIVRQVSPQEAAD
jgi:hypothetical protein